MNPRRRNWRKRVTDERIVFDDGSDLALLVDVAPDVSLFAYVGLQLDLEDAFVVKVEVCTPEELHPAIGERILGEARPL